MATKPKKIVPKKVSVPKKVAPVKNEDADEDTGADSEDESADESTTDEDETDEDDAPEKLRSSQDVEKESVDVANDGDYIRQYQYKKVNNVPTIGGELTDPDKGSKAERMKAALLLQPRINMMIPLPEGTDPKVPQSVTLNGYRLDLPTNTYIQVPEQVAQIIINSNEKTNGALSQFKISGDTKKEGALQ